MLKRKWSVVLVLAGSTAIAAAALAFALQSTRAYAQTSADCKILEEETNKYGKLAYQTSLFVAKGYVASGLAAQGGYLYTLVCKR